MPYYTKDRDPPSTGGGETTEVVQGCLGIELNFKRVGSNQT